MKKIRIPNKNVKSATEEIFAVRSQIRRNFLIFIMKLNLWYCRLSIKV